jgi:hypothetical protein
MFLIVKISFLCIECINRDQETPKREAKGPSWTVSACE